MGKILRKPVFPFFCGFFEKFFLKKIVSLGRYGEWEAARFLKKNGYAILSRNYINKKGYRSGEIDIVAQEGETIVFVEVKTRMRASSGDLPPETAITKKKMKHLERCAYRYLREKRVLEKQYRFDAVSVMYTRNGEKEIRHLQNIFV